MEIDWEYKICYINCGDDNISLANKNYKNRLVDKKIKEYLAVFGALN